MSCFLSSRSVSSFAKRRAVGIPSIGIARGVLATEVHPSFPLMHRRDRHVGRVVHGSTGWSVPAAIDGGQASSQAMNVRTMEELKCGIGV